MDFLLLLCPLLCEGEAGIPPESFVGCERLDCEGEEGKDEEIGHWFSAGDAERKLEEHGELRARRHAGETEGFFWGREIQGIKSMCIISGWLANQYCSTWLHSSLHVYYNYAV